MNRSYKPSLHPALRLALAASAVGQFLATPVVFAQDAAPASADNQEATELMPMLITGSLIPTAASVGPAPVDIAPDDFGVPETSFTVCNFWYVDALAATGRTDQARKLFESLLEHRNPLGLLSEDIATETGELWGNYPQTYSMVGLINSAMRLSRSWEELL